MKQDKNGKCEFQADEKGRKKREPERIEDGRNVLLFQSRARVFFFSSSSTLIIIIICSQQFPMSFRAAAAAAAAFPPPDVDRSDDLPLY